MASIKIRAKASNGVTTVKTLMSHPMETGLRKDNKTGKNIPAHHITEVTAEHNGKVVMVDFTADWCINCKAYKRLVLDRDPVLTRTQAQDVVVFEADTTSKTDPANDLMEDLGITGIPHLAIYGPGLDQPLLSNNASAGEVLRRLNQAAGTEPTASASR